MPSLIQHYEQKQEAPLKVVGHVATNLSEIQKENQQPAKTNERGPS